jgi:hypothetical protein
MSFRKKDRVLLGAGLLLAGLGFGAVGNCGAAGLSCSIGEVLIENLKIGHQVSLQDLANLPLSITNTGDQPVVVRVDGIVPRGDELRQGAAPIPDPSWTYATPDSFVLTPHGTQLVDLGFKIPDDPALLGKKYQASFWSHTLAKPGDFIACGLSSRVIFTIDPVREDVGAAASHGAAASLLPPEVTVRGLDEGRSRSLESCLDRPLVIRNPSNQSIVVDLNALHPQLSALGLPTGFGDLLDVAKVDISPSQLRLGPGEERKVAGSILFPVGVTFPEKTLMCVVSARVAGKEVTTGIYSRIYASVP